jgi:hypothetical protein
MASQVKSKRGVRNKGANGEREVKDKFIAAMRWIEAAYIPQGEFPSEAVKRNSTQSDRGGHDLLGVPGLSIEVKRQEAVSLGSWWEQCQMQAKRLGGCPTLIWRQNNRPWRVRTWGAYAGQWLIVECDFEDWLKAWQSDYRRHIEENLRWMKKSG